MDKREKVDEHQSRVSRFVEFFERVSRPEPNEVKRKSDKNQHRTDEMSDGDSDGLVVAERKRSGKRKHRKGHKKQKKAKKHKRHKHHRTDGTESDDSQRKTFDSENSEEEDKDGKEEEDEAAGGELVGGRPSAKDLDKQQHYRPRYESPKRDRERTPKDERHTASQLTGCGEADYPDVHKSSEYNGSKSRFQGHGSQRRAYDERLTTRDEYRRQPPDRHYCGSTRYSALSRYSGERSRKPSEPQGGREVTTKGTSDHQRRRSTPSPSSPDERRFDAANYYRWHDESGRHPYHSRRIPDHRRSRSGPRDERDSRVQRGPDHRREHGYSQERSARNRPAKDERFARQAASRWDSPGGKEYREQRNSPDYDGSHRYYGNHKTEARMSGRKRFYGERGPTRDEYRHKSPEYSHSVPNSSADIPRRSANGDYRERYSGERSYNGIRKQREPNESAVSRTENGRPRHRSPQSQNDDRRSDRNDAGYEYRRIYDSSQQRGDRPISPYRSSRTKQQRRSQSGSRSKREEREERGSQHETDHRRAVGNRSGMHSTSHATDRRLERLPHSPGERLQRKSSRSPPRSFLHDGGVKTEGHAMVKVEKQSDGYVEIKKEPNVGKQEQSKSGKLALDRPAKDEQARFGKTGDSEAEDGEPSVVEKQKPNFALSGKLTEETNKVNGVVIMYSEPPGARKPKRRWRLYPFKGDQALPTLYIHRQSCYLIGRDRKICDLPIDHPSCSKQHAVIQYRLVANEREDGSTGKCVRPYIIDLESANGTFVNYKQIEPKRYLQLFEKDVLKFGFSSREYVLLDENSKEQQQEDEEDDERLDEIT